MSGQPSPSRSTKAQPEPRVSGRYFLPARPLLWVKWIPACAVTSVNTGPDAGGGAPATARIPARIIAAAYHCFTYERLTAAVLLASVADRGLAGPPDCPRGSRPFA